MNMYVISAWFWHFFIAPWRKKKVLGQQNIPFSGPFIISAIHVGRFDPWDIVEALDKKFYSWEIVKDFGYKRRPVHWIAKSELFDPSLTKNEFGGKFPWPINWCIGYLVTFIVKYSLSIPVDRNFENGGKKVLTTNRRMLREVGNVLDSGDIVGIFPEGGIKREGSVYTTFLKIAKKHKVPILPVCFTNNAIKFLPLVSVENLSVIEETPEIAQKIMTGTYTFT